MDAVVAMLDPEIAAKPPQARIVACESPPRIMPDHGMGRVIKLVADARPVDQVAHQQEQGDHGQAVIC